MPEEQTQQPPITALAPAVSLEELKYREQLAKDIGLPSPYGMNLLKSTCQDLVDSGFAPSCFGKNPMSLFLAAMRGREMGLAPTESIMETFWASPQNRLGMFAGKMLEIMHKNGVKSKFITETAEECEILFTPPGGHEPYTSVFNISEAKTAGLVKKDSNWEKWPKAMNRSRAISIGWRALNGTFGIAGANVYTPDEIADIEADAPPENKAPESTEVKAGMRPKADKADVVVEAKAEVVTEPAKDEPAKAAEKVTPINRPTPPPTTDKPAAERTIMKTEYEVWVDGADSCVKAFPGFEAAGIRAQALKDELKKNTLVQRVATYDSGNPDFKVIAKFDYEPEVAGTPDKVSEAEALTDIKTVPVSDTEVQKSSGASDAEKEAVAAAKARFEALRDNIPARTDEERDRVAKLFISGFFGVSVVKEWPRKPDARNKAMDALEAALGRATDRDFVLNSPKEAGKRASLIPPVTNDPAYAGLNWTAETISVAKAFREAFVLHGVDDFTSYYANFLKGDEIDAVAYMRVGAISGRGTNTLRLLREACAKTGEPYSAVVGTVTKFVGDLSKEKIPQIEAALTKMAGGEAIEAGGPAEEDPNW